MRGLTVVIPVWGGYERYLDTLYAVLVAQGVADEQMLVIVNGDRDLAARLASFWPGKLVAVEERLSIGAVRNAALAYVHTPLVCFCDADDEPAPGALAMLIAALDAHPGALVATGLARRLTVTGDEPYPWPPRWAARRMAPRVRVAVQWAFNHVSVTTGAVIRAQALRDAGGFPDSQLAEDGALACLLAALGQVAVLAVPTRLYRTHADGLCQRGHSAARWRAAYAVQRDWLASHPSLGRARWLAHCYRPAHWLLARRLGAVARHDI